MMIPGTGIAIRWYHNLNGVRAMSRVVRELEIVIPRAVYRAHGVVGYHIRLAIEPSFPRSNDALNCGGCWVQFPVRPIFLNVVSIMINSHWVSDQFFKKEKCERTKKIVIIHFSTNKNNVKITIKLK